MSLSTSKSKTQLAYARSGKAITKPKSKNTNPSQSNEANKQKNNTKNSGSNIYDSIMGQIDSNQQDYIKSLITKNQRQSLKQNKKSTVPQNELKKNVLNSSQKSIKQVQSSKKIPGVQSHERTRSQAQLLKLIVSQNQIDNINSTPKAQIITSQVFKTQQGQIPQSNEDSNRQLKLKSKNKGTKQSFFTKQILFQEQNKSLNRNQSSKQSLKNPNSNPINRNSVNPIIQVLNSSVSSFAKKLQISELQYPQNQQRQQRSTHKKVAPKIVAGNYFSCQVSPKNSGKNLYTNEVVITTKPEQSYNFGKKQFSSMNMSQPISPVNQKSSNKNNQSSGLNKSKKAKQANFLQCLDQYLQALNVSQNIEQSKKRSMKRNYKMSSKQYIAQPFTLGKEQLQQQQTIVLGNLNSRMHLPSQKYHSYQQQKLIKIIQKQKNQLQQLIEAINQYKYQLGKQKKKEKKLKQNQYHMIQCLKSLNQQLTEEKKQKRKLQEIVKQFNQKFRDISRGNSKDNKQAYNSIERPERRTIYATSSVGNSIHYQHVPMKNMPIQMNNYTQNYLNQDVQKNNFFQDKSNISKLGKHGKKPSKSRFSSMINNFTQQYIPNYMNQDVQQENNYPYKHQIIREGINKNRTQKINKIISSFELDNHPFDQETSSKYNLNSYKYNDPICYGKKNYMNSSLPNKKSRPTTPKIIDQLFNSKGNCNKNKYCDQNNFSDQDSDNQPGHLLGQHNKFIKRVQHSDYQRNHSEQSNEEQQNNQQNNRRAQYDFNGQNQTHNRRAPYLGNNYQQYEMIARMR